MSAIRPAIDQHLDIVSQSSSAGSVSLGNRASRVIEAGREEAVALDHDYCGTEHLLLGLIREGGPASHLLGEHGITLGIARLEVQRLTG